MQIGPARSPTERAFIFQADGAWNAARSSRIRSFGADGHPTTATLCFHYCHLMIQISVCDYTHNFAAVGTVSSPRDVRIPFVFNSAFLE